MALGTITEWKQVLELDFLGEPEGQMRPRHHIINPKDGSKPFTSTYSPKSRWYNSVMQQAVNHVIESPNIRKPISAPVMVELNFRMKRIKSLPKTKEIPHTKKPDIDNLAKALLDAITPTILSDDNLVIDLHATKRYALKNESPGCRIVISARHEVHV